MPVDTLSLAGKIAIVTGSGRENGIGAAIAVALARNGASVTINYVSDSVTERAHAVASRIMADGGHAVVVQTTIDTPEGARHLVQETLKAFNADHIDILSMLHGSSITRLKPGTDCVHSVNNAGVGFAANTLAISSEQVTKTLDVNIKGPILVAQAVVPYMPPGGRIINTSSIASKLGDANIPAYGASKAALDSLTWSWAKEVS
jgi:NAD(P)-dependent dehydrogenase (short-subunit alcohol dehydrogenase family)